MQKDPWLAQSRENYNRDLPKVGKSDRQFSLFKVRKVTKVTCPKLVKVTSNLLTTGSQIILFKGEL